MIKKNHTSRKNKFTPREIILLKNSKREEKTSKGKIVTA